MSRWWPRYSRTDSPAPTSTRWAVFCPSSPPNLRTKLSCTAERRIDESFGRPHRHAADSSRRQYFAFAERGPTLLCIPDVKAAARSQWVASVIADLRDNPHWCSDTTGSGPTTRSATDGVRRGGGPLRDGPPESASKRVQRVSQQLPPYISICMGKQVKAASCDRTLDQTDIAARQEGRCRGREQGTGQSRTSSMTGMTRVVLR